MSRRLEREIARRLQERGPAQPPAGLLGRIQAEIPDSLKIGSDAAANLRETHRPAARRVWLVAASLAAMFGAGVLSYRLFEADRALFSVPQSPRAEKAPAAPPPEENRPASPRAVPATPPPPAASVPAPRLKKQRAPEASPSLLEEPQGAAGGAVGGVPGGVLGGEPAGAPAPSEEPAPAPAAPGAADVQERAEPRLSQRAAPSTALGSPAAADRAEGAAPAPPQAKSALAKPERFRAAGKVAAPPPTPPKPEGAPSPFASEGRRIVLLLPPEAEVTSDPAVVARSRRSVSSGPDVLYEVELRPGAPAEAVVAGRNGEPLLRVRDLAPSFERASPGFRLAALEAELAAVQAGTRPRSELPELRRLARALAAELPADPRAASLVSRLDRLSP